MLWWIGRVNRVRHPACMRSLGFNPCCGGLVASTAGVQAGRASSMFQSLLWWIGRVNAHRDRLIRPLDPPVSILVVVDWSRQLAMPRTTRGGPGFGFNPCCGGLVASTPCDTDRPDADVRVSILVVVDWSRQHGDRRVSNASRRRCFNPCCGGSVASTGSSRRQSSRAGYSFNPCCGGLVASTTIESSSCDRPTASFNPCCGGLVASTAAVRDALDADAVRVSILVVVDWSRQPGCTVSADRVEADMFQSLLWWIGRVNSIDLPGDEPVVRFQSLLWWIGRVNIGYAACHRVTA